MKLRMLALLLVLLPVFGCGYGSKYSGPMMSGGAVSISQIAPNSAGAGAAGFMLTISGSGFTSNSVLYWNTVPHAAMMVSANQLTTTISDADIANPGTVMVYVRSNSRNSNSVTFVVE